MQLSTFTDPSVVGPRNIPAIKFVEDVEAFVGEHNPTQLIQGLTELHSKFKFMETSLTRQQEALKEKIRDISEALEVVRGLLKRQEGGETDFTTYYQLADSIYSQAIVPSTDTVSLWLGANVMLEYPIGEAATLLENNLKSAEESVIGLRADIEYLRRQITTAEVSIARVHNFNVKLRKSSRAEEGRS